MFGFDRKDVQRVTVSGLGALTLTVADRTTSIRHASPLFDMAEPPSEDSAELGA